MMARRGRPEKIYSDNFSTFVSASKWLKNVIRNEAVHDYLASNEIKWQFNLSRAPWWGGQFERMVSLVKQSLYKVIGKALLSKEELEEVLLDVELCLNNRPLSYVEDDHEMPILTPNVMSFGVRINCGNVGRTSTYGAYANVMIKRTARKATQSKLVTL